MAIEQYETLSVLKNGRLQIPTIDFGASPDCFTSADPVLIGGQVDKRLVEDGMNALFCMYRYNYITYTVYI